MAPGLIGSERNMAQEQKVGSFGERLRRAREMRGISLDEIATQTKISARNLRALENEKFDQLPGGIFNKGFVRAYAKFLGIDEEHMVAEYVTASQDTEAAREEKLKDEFARAEFRRPKNDDRDISLEPKSQWGTIAVIVLIAVLAFGGWQVYQKKKAERARQRSEALPTRVAPVQTAPTTAVPPMQNQTTNAASASGAAVATGTSAAASNGMTPDKSQATVPAGQKPATDQTATPDQSKAAPVTETGASPIDLKLKLTQQSWVSIKADGKLLVSDNLPSGTEKSVKAHEKVEMVLGNSGGVELTYNGKPVENLPKGQDVRKITFTPSGYE
jgi:cytoskeleton protein RodZ